MQNTIYETGVKCRNCLKECRIVYEFDDVLLCKECVDDKLKAKEVQDE